MGIIIIIHHPFFLLLLFPIVTIWPIVADGFVSRRAKCAIECYIKCANSGTPKAVYCHCPLAVESDPCNSVTEQLLTEKTVERPIEMDSGYKDIRTIWLRVDPVPAAFIYIFEFSIQSVEKPLWAFAGASSSPQISFAVPDPCRDYQFRTIVVLRSNNPLEQLVVFRPATIPTHFPAFAVPNESIHLDRPKQSADEQTLHVSVSWQHPFGYDDSDVYGYSPPTAYPISCQMAPEARLSAPRLELVKGGARMHLAMPADVLRERCRVYMEVRMLPRCVRIDPFDVQISVELDCQKFPELRYCQKEHGAQCTDVVDLWGKDDGRAIVVWQRPGGPQQGRAPGRPLFYSVHWGTTQSQGSPASRRIVQSRHLRVPGNMTKAELDGVQPGVHYGLQICARFSPNENDPDPGPVHSVPVIPFTCTRCQKNGPGGGATPSERCIDCSKIEEAKPRTSTSSPKNHSQAGALSDAPNPLQSVHFISSDTVMLDVFGANVTVGGGGGGGEGWGTSANPSEDEEIAGGQEQEQTQTEEGVEAQEGGGEGEEEQSLMRHFKTYWPNGEPSELATTAEAKVTEGIRAKDETPEGTKPKMEAPKGREWSKAEDKNKTNEGTTPRRREEGTTEGTTMKMRGRMEDEEDERRKIMEERNGRTTEGTTKKKEPSAGEVTRQSEEEGTLATTTIRLPTTTEPIGQVQKKVEMGERTRESRMEEPRPKEDDNSRRDVDEPGKEDKQLDGVRRKPAENHAQHFMFGSLDSRKWMLAGPALGIIALFLGVVLLLVVLIRLRRQRHHRHRAGLPSGYGPPSLCAPHKYTGAGVRMPRGRSVLASRTLAAKGAATGPAFGLIGTPTIGLPTTVSTSLGSSSASSSGASSASSATTSASSPPASSASVPPNPTSASASASVPIHHLPPHLASHPSAHFFADNTARFFMNPPHPSSSISKNVHF